MTDAPPSLLRRALRDPARIAVRAWEIASGLLYVSRPMRVLRRRRDARAVPPANVRAAMLAHVYYPELWGEVLACWRALPAGSHLLVTAPPAQAEQVRALAADDPLIEVYPHPNRGRDIAATVALLDRGVLDRFDAVLKIHTKRSPHLVRGDLRRRVLYLGLAGDRGQVARILSAFSDERTGMVGVRSFWRAHRRWWLMNRATVESLAGAMRVPARLGFFEGSMFWFRPAALEPLRGLGLRTESFDAEQGQVDGTLHHAVERVFTLAVTATGRTVRATDGLALMDPTDENSASLPAAISRTGASASGAARPG